MARKKKQLTQRDQRILKFVERYRIGTDQLLGEFCFDGPNRSDNARRVLRRLVVRRLLRRVSLGSSLSYVILTRRGQRAIGAPESTPRRMTEQSLPAALAIAWFCVRNGVSRQINREFRQRFPELWQTGSQCSNYYFVDTAEGMKLGLFLVDRGGTARRITRKIRRLTSQRASLPAFSELIAARRFRICVLTGLPAQQQVVRRQLGGSNFFLNVEVQVALVPELGYLLTHG